MLRVFSACAALTSQVPQPFLLNLRALEATMDARGTVAARATALVVCQANAAAVEQCAQLRRAVLGAQAAVYAGDRALALRLLAEALGHQPPEVPQRGARHTCSMCGRQTRATYWRPAAAWPTLPARERQLCAPCYRMRP